MKPVAMCQIRTLLSVLAATLLLVSAASASGKSSQDQYEQRDQAQTESDGHKPVLNRVQLTSTGLHRFGLLPPGIPDKKTEVQDLQVGCGDGSVKVPPKSEAAVQVVNKKRMRRDTDNARQKRNYIHWYGASTSQYNPPIQSFQVHGIQSSVPSAWTQMSHPYQIVIPLWGNPRGVPVFFPPKPIYFNPGYPMHNRPRQPEITQSSENKTAEGTTESPTDGFTIGSRFKPEEDDGPVWGVVESEEDTGAASRTTTRRPALQRPSLGEDGEGNVPQSFRQSEEDLQSIRPTQRPQPTTTVASEKQLNRCVWAIISCCNPSNTLIRYNCFENLGCPGAFWDKNPCSKEVTQAALNAAQEFYDQS